MSGTIEADGSGYMRIAVGNGETFCAVKPTKSVEFFRRLEYLPVKQALPFRPAFLKQLGRLDLPSLHSPDPEKRMTTGAGRISP